jgi:hypothetical protein
MDETRLTRAVARIELLARRDPGRRGFSSCAPSGLLLPAATDLYGGERIVLITGFCIRSAMIGETDGPPGTLALADALRQLGKEVMLVTDRYSAGLLEAGVAMSGAPYRLVVLESDQAAAEIAVRQGIANFAPTHVVSIERPGSAADGHLYTMRGERLDDCVPSLDYLFASSEERAYRTLAVGDGGNELGMGKLREALKAHVNHGELISCITPADHAIPAGISNWGAYALAAALSLLADRMLLRAPAREREIFDAMLRAGAVDGFSGRCEPAVDGVPWPIYADTLGDIHAEVMQALDYSDA